MKCINDIELMEFISGKLNAERKTQVQNHLNACEKCSERFKEASKLWDTLGSWKVDTTSHNIADRVMTSAKKSAIIQKSPEHHFTIKRGFWFDALRIAASIIIAIGIGQKLGKISAGQKPSTNLTSQNEPKYIAALGLDWADDFTWLIMEDDSSVQENKNE